MKQVIIHCTNNANLDQQLLDAGHYYQLDDRKDPYLPVSSKGMTVKANNQCLVCVLVTDYDRNKIESISSLSILGSYKEIFSNPEKEAIYSNIYDRSTVTMIDEETGEKSTYTPSDKFAVFAGFEDES